MNVGFIGLGAMGASMARHLHARGLLAAVGNRSAEKAQALALELNVRQAKSADDFSNCVVTCLCVSADSDVLEVATTLAAVLAAGTVVVDHSTVAMKTAQQAAAILAARGIGFVDAPVSGGVEGARNGKLSVMAGGSAADLALAQPALACFASRVTHMGEVGKGQATKAVNQVLVAGIAEGVCEGLALAEKLGLDPAQLLPTLGAGAAANWFLDKRGATMLASNFTPGFKCALLLKDLHIVETMAREAGVRSDVIERARRDYTELVLHGHGDEDTSALIRLKRGG